MTTTTKKRPSRRAAKKPMPLENATVRKAAKLGAIGTGAWLAGRAVMSIVRVVVGTALVAAAAAAAVAFVPKPVQRQIAGNVRDAARLAREKAVSQARSYGLAG
jgi:hypothetical protein